MLLLMLMLVPMNMLDVRRELFNNLRTIWNNLTFDENNLIQTKEKYHKAQCNDDCCNGDGDDVVVSVDHSGDEDDHANDDDDNLR